MNFISREEVVREIILRHTFFLRDIKVLAGYYLCFCGWHKWLSNVAMGNVAFIREYKDEDKFLTTVCMRCSQEKSGARDYFNRKLGI